MKYAIFDMDGTLIDSMPIWNNLGVDILKANGVSYPDNILEILTPLGINKGSEYLIELGLNMTKEEIFRAEVSYAAKYYEESIPLKKGALEYLKRLKKEGVKMSVLTASPHVFIDPCLKRLKVDGFFDYIVSAEDIGVTKSEVKSFEILLEKMGAKPHETVMFDDNLKALETAKKAGLITCGVYDEASEGSMEEIKKLADVYIESFENLLQRLR